jgi:hypothetical protein
LASACRLSRTRWRLELTAGTYAIELRADGYETYSGELVVEASKTLTERVSLKKIQ